MYEDEKRLVSLILAIGSQYALRVERWRDEYGSWRAGTEWYGDMDYRYIAEGKTLTEALERIAELEGITV